MTPSNFQPRKRIDLKELSDKVYALKSAIKFKISLEAQIKLQEKLISTMKRPSLLGLALMVLYNNFWRISYLKKKLEIHRLENDNVIKEKQMNIYHRNELIFEDQFENIYEEMAERFDDYLNQLQRLHETFASTDEKDCSIPIKDVRILLNKYRTEAPKDKIERLSFYLSMESTLHQCRP
jgi:hypothetical protein